MHRLLITSIRLLLASLFFALPAQCAANTSQGFIFPRVSNASVPHVSNITASINDSMIVSYTQFEYVTALSMAIYCYDSVKDAISNQTKGAVGGGWGYYFGPCESPLSTTSDSYNYRTNRN